MTNINPQYKFQHREIPSIEVLRKGIVSGDIQTLSHALSIAESKNKEHRNLINELLSSLPKTLKTQRIAITGSPGVGKSSLLNAMVSKRVNQNSKIAIIAVDPSSEKSLGSILGDKTRMEDLISDHNTFIRPIASGNEKGGIAESTMRAVHLCESAGYEKVFIETVGVGQSAFEVSKIADLFILVLNPVGGDDLQGIKRGIVEMADILVINKSDGKLLSNASDSQRNYSNSVKFHLPKDSQWIPKVVKASSLEQTGMDQIWEHLETYFNFIEENGYLENSRISNAQYWLQKELSNTLVEQYLGDDSRKQHFEQLMQNLILGGNYYNALNALSKEMRK